MSPAARTDHVQRTGAGPAVVLIHGVGSSLGMWDGVVAKLKSRCDVLTYDMVGHGAGPHPAGPYTLATYVEQLDRILTAAKLDAITLVGFSMGALVAQGFTLRYPKKVSRLMLLNGVFDRSPAERAAVLERVTLAEVEGPSAGADAAIERWFTPGFAKSHPDVIAGTLRELLANDPKAFPAAYRVFATADAEIAPQAGQITCPTLVVTGAEDRRSTADMARRLTAKLSQGRCIILPEQRHLTPLEVPAQIADTVAALARGEG